MRKNSLLVLALVVLFSLSSCKKTKTVKDLEDAYLPKPAMSLTQADTAEVKAQVDHYLNLLKGNKKEEAMAMLYYLRGDSIVKMPEEMRERFMTYYSRVQGIKYDVEYLKFYSEIDSEVKYTVTLFENKPGENLPNKMSFVIKPVRREGKWYLTLADTQTDSHDLRSKKNRY
ncbi:MAG: hypothetical protein PUH24_03815 [Prevotellaceae bacterium]|nr:hypothetical protein [Prevotellaceae bacterium]MDY6131205.1 hypothetical protein [Prevotella sp.]